MIKIVLLLLLFLFYVYVSMQREGLKNYQPIDRDGKVYGVNVLKGRENHIFDTLLDQEGPLFQNRFIHYHRSDVILDMQYFNNATYLLYSNALPVL
jgi:hypothetical protein